MSLRSPALALALALPAAAQGLGPILHADSLVPGLGVHRCGSPSAAVDGPLDHVDCDLDGTNPSSTYEPSTVVRIPVVVHVIRSNGGTGDLTDAVVRSQIDVLNEDFRALAGTPGAPGYDTRIEFFLAAQDPLGNPTSGIRRYNNSSWFGDNGDYWLSIAWDTTRYLNIYTNNVANGAVLGYVPALPQSNLVLGTSADRVVIHYRVFGRPGALAPYDRGRTAVHEVGHWLGLLHTFHGGCGGACLMSGDLLCDTAAESQPRFGCPLGASSCGSPDPVRNYMDYTDDACMDHFTQQQARRMRCTLQHYRPGLAVPAGPLASATVRTGAGNLNDKYQCTPPVLGGTMDAHVVMFGTPYTLAAILGHAGAANVPFHGQTLLLDAASPLLLQSPLLFPISGVVAAWSMPIPAVQSLAGLPIKTQAVLFGTDFALTNAVDLVVGN